MATKAAETVERTETREESGDGPLMDSLSASVKKMVQRAKERGYITYDELNQALPHDQVSSEQIEDTMAMLSEMGITVTENEEREETPNEEEESNQRVAGNLDDDDIGRTDDPVRMYLREMGSVELLSREGEIAIAKRIEAGRERMISGICENPLTIIALLAWRDALLDNKILLRDIIDLDATYGGGPEGDRPVGDGAAPVVKPDGISGPTLVTTNAEPVAAAGPDKAKGQGEDEGEGEGEGEGEENETDELAGLDDDEDQEEETNISLAAMEAALLPTGVGDDRRHRCHLQETPQESRKSGSPLLQAGEAIPTQTERRYQKLTNELIEQDEIGALQRRAHRTAGRSIVQPQ